MKNSFAAVAGRLYPTIPATWPNRAVRRAVRTNRGVPNEWVLFFAKFPHLRSFILTGKM